MTEIARTYLGNTNHNPELAKLVTTECLEVSLPESDRHKGRIHTQSDSGITVGIIKSRDRSLQSGDLFKTESGQLLLVNLQAQELLVLDLSNLDPTISVSSLVNLGHVLGNHHYPITIENNHIYIQLVTDKLIIEKLINNLNIPGLKIKYQTLKVNQIITFYTHDN